MLQPNCASVESMNSSGQLPYAAMTKSVYVPCCQISEDQETQNAQEDGQCHEQAGYPVEEPEDSSETHNGHGGPYGRYAVCIEPTENDGCRDGQREGLCPSAARYLFDMFFCFHNLPVLVGIPFPFSGGFLQSASTGKVFEINTGVKRG